MLIELIALTRTTLQKRNGHDRQVHRLKNGSAQTGNHFARPRTARPKKIPAHTPKITHPPARAVAGRADRRPVHSWANFLFRINSREDKASPSLTLSSASWDIRLEGKPDSGPLAASADAAADSAFRMAFAIESSVKTRRVCIRQLLRRCSCASRSASATVSLGLPPCCCGSPQCVSDGWYDRPPPPAPRGLMMFGISGGFLGILWLLNWDFIEQVRPEKSQEHDPCARYPVGSPLRYRASCYLANFGNV